MNSSDEDDAYTEGKAVIGCLSDRRSSKQIKRNKIKTKKPAEPQTCEDIEVK